MTVGIRTSAAARTIIVIMCGAAALASSPLWSAQQRSVPALTLSGTGTELPVPFSHVTAVRELRDGRVVVSDACERGIFVLDFESGSRRKVGREGVGPGEYQMPYIALASRGDTTIVLDIGGQKFVSVTPQGEVIPLNSPADRSSTTRQLTFTFSTHIQTDSLGRIYSNGSGTLRRSGQPSLSLDSTAIIRFDPRSGATDTIAFIPTTAGSSGSARAGAGSRAATIPSPASAEARVPYRASAAWVVARDGSVAIIKPEPFTLEWIAPDGRGSGPRQLSHQPVRITDAEKEEELNPRLEQRGGCDMSVRRDLADGAIGTFRRSFALPISAARPSISWPEFKHPYTNDDNAIVATEASEIMVLASRAANDPVPRYDVYDRDGVLVRSVRLPAGTRMLGLGRGFIYLARNDQDGLQYLSRHRLAR